MRSATSSKPRLPRMLIAILLSIAPLATTPVRDRTQAMLSLHKVMSARKATRYTAGRRIVAHPSVARCYRRPAIPRQPLSRGGLISGAAGPAMSPKVPLRHDSADPRVEENIHENRTCGHLAVPLSCFRSPASVADLCDSPFLIEHRCRGSVSIASNGSSAPDGDGPFALTDTLRSTGLLNRQQTTHVGAEGTRNRWT